MDGHQLQQRHVGAHIGVAVGVEDIHSPRRAVTAGKLVVAGGCPDTDVAGVGEGQSWQLEDSGSLMPEPDRVGSWGHW